MFPSVKLSLSDLRVAFSKIYRINENIRPFFSNRYNDEYSQQADLKERCGLYTTDTAGTDGRNKDRMKGKRGEKEGTTERKR